MSCRRWHDDAPARALLCLGVLPSQEGSFALTAPNVEARRPLLSVGPSVSFIPPVLWAGGPTTPGWAHAVRGRRVGGVGVAYGARTRNLWSHNPVLCRLS